MAVSPRAVALGGFGFGALVLALDGFALVASPVVADVAGTASAEVAHVYLALGSVVAVDCAHAEIVTAHLAVCADVAVDTASAEVETVDTATSDVADIYTATAEIGSC